MPPAHNPSRFTVDGGVGLEALLAARCAEVRRRVAALFPARGLAGLLLGGGYGRGEGGVLETPEGEQPYNDLEFYVFVRGPLWLARQRHNAALHALGRRLSAEMGIDVEFALLTPAALRAAPPSMFYYDLLLGHRALVAADSLLAGCDHLRLPEAIPWHDATRLLMNRCAGLLFSAARLRGKNFRPDDADFVGRNLAKAQLAFGDVVLTVHRQYHWSCRERRARLQRGVFDLAPEMLAAICHDHAAGVAFKLHPTRADARRDELALEHERISATAQQLWLWLENLRLGTDFASTREYALSPADKCPEQSPTRNRAINVRAFGVAGLACPRHPRERLLHALPLLLWERAAATSPVLLRRVQQELRTRAADFNGLVSAFENLWHRFN